MDPHGTIRETEGTMWCHQSKRWHAWPLAAAAEAMSPTWYLDWCSPPPVNHFLVAASSDQLWEQNSKNAFNLCTNKVKVGSNCHGPVCTAAQNHFRNFRNKLLSAEMSTRDWCVCLFVCCWLWPERPSFPTFDVRTVWFEKGAQARLNIPADLSLI